MPIPWNHKNQHLLGKNFNLSKKILLSNLKKLEKSPELLQMYDGVIVDQQKNGIIQKIENPESFLSQHPQHAFLPHMGIFKLSKETSKCRIVYMSNLCEKDYSKNLTVSHNQCILPGPCLNAKISTALISLKFDKWTLVFDICHAFLSIGLPEIDQARLLFLWFEDVSKNNFDIVYYKSQRLPFGLRASPMMLMCALYRILIQDSDEDVNVQEFKTQLYHNFYVDNGGYTTNDPTDLRSAYSKSQKVLEPYGFYLQKFYTNCQDLQQDIDADQESAAEEEIKLLSTSMLTWQLSKC